MHPYPEAAVRVAAAPPEAYIVVFKDHVDHEAAEAHIDSVISHHDNIISASSGPSLSGVEHRCSIDGFKAYSGCFHDDTLEHIRSCSEVDFIERDQVMLAQDIISQENVPSYGIARISQKTNNDLTTYYYDETAGQGVTAYVIDTGINITHKDFGGRAVWGFNAADSNDDDAAGHGTHVAGTIGGTTYGVAKNVSLIAVKVLGSDGSGTTAGVIRGITWATTDAQSKGISKTSVANMSLGGGFSAALNKAVDAAVQSGITFMVAAGNENVDAAGSSPASVKSAVTIGASEKDDSKAKYSNYGAIVDVYAPGTGITSAWIGSDTATNTISGTSMATPHVTGLAAYLIAAETISGARSVKARINELAIKGIVINPGPATTDALVYNGSGR